MEYTPDGWMLLKVSGTNGNIHYRVFGSWSGGYLDGDSWRINSGITKVERDGTDYLFHGASGSVYRCRENSYGRITAYNHGVLDDYEKKHNGLMVVLPFLPDNIGELV